MIKKKKKKEDKQFGTLADFQFGTSSIIASTFEGLVGYRTFCHEGQVPLKAYDCVLAEISWPPFVLQHMACPTYRVYQLCDKCKIN